MYTKMIYICVNNSEYMCTDLCYYYKHTYIIVMYISTYHIVLTKHNYIYFPILYSNNIIITYIYNITMTKPLTHKF